MPEFNSGEAKTAVVQMTNPTPAPFDYSATLYMGVNMAALCNREFSLVAEETKNISFPVTMPFEPGIYPVYFDVWSNGMPLGHYQAVEDVVILQAQPVYCCPLCGKGYDEIDSPFLTYEDLLYHSKYRCSYTFYCGGGTSVGDKYYFRACCPFCDEIWYDLYRVRYQTTVREVAAAKVMPHIRDHHPSEILCQND